mgnify:CR=1 FL=1
MMYNRLGEMLLSPSLYLAEANTASFVKAKGTSLTNEELNTALYEKMFSEQETYRAWLLAQPPEEILNHTYEYTVREDILMSLEYNSLPNTQVQALLKSPSPLADVFAAWEDRETSYMEEIWQTVTVRAKEETQKFRNAQKER